jgi:hypothetical protein
MFTPLESTPRSGDAWRWWESRRLRYNIALAVAGSVAYGLYVLQILIITPRLEGGLWPLQASHTVWAGLCWLVVMAMANILFLLGPISEKVLRPAEVDGYRRRMFGLGLWFSVALPFLFPAMMLVSMLSQAGF